MLAKTAVFFFFFCSGKSVLYSFMVADVKITHGRPKDTMKLLRILSVGLTAQEKCQMTVFVVEKLCIMQKKCSGKAIYFLNFVLLCFHNWGHWGLVIINSRSEV